MGVFEGAKVEELERVEAGWTGPRVRREWAKWGSEASRVMAVDGVLVQWFGGMRGEGGELDTILRGGGCAREMQRGWFFLWGGGGGGGGGRMGV